MFDRLNITGFTLKVLAIVGMTCNHIAHAFMPYMPHWLTFVLYSLGGMTYPIMAFILVEGYVHTSNLKKYAFRLFIFALVSQVPYYLMFGWTANVLFTLLMGLGLLWAKDNITSKPLFVLMVIAAEVISLKCDWAVAGPLIVLCFYIFRDQGGKGIAKTMVIPYIVVGAPAVFKLAFEVARMLTDSSALLANYEFDMLLRSYIMLNMTGEPLFLSMNGYVQLCMLGYALIGFSLAWFFILFYKGKRGPSMKWFFYAYYPLHIFVIWAIKTLLR